MGNGSSNIDASAEAEHRPETKELTATETTAICLEVTFEEVWRAAMGENDSRADMNHLMVNKVQDLTPIGDSFDDSTWNTLDHSVNGWQNKNRGPVEIVMDDDVVLPKFENEEEILAADMPIGPYGGRQPTSREGRGRDRSSSRVHRGNSKTKTRSRSTNKNRSRSQSRHRKQGSDIRLYQSDLSREKEHEYEIMRNQRGTSRDRRQGREINRSEISENSASKTRTRQSSRGRRNKPATKTRPEPSDGPASRDKRSRSRQRSHPSNKENGRGTKDEHPPVDKVQHTRGTQSQSRSVSRSARSANKNNKLIGDDEVKTKRSPIRSTHPESKRKKSSWRILEEAPR